MDSTMKLCISKMCLICLFFPSLGWTLENGGTVDRSEAFCSVERNSAIEGSSKILVALFFERGCKDVCNELAKTKNQTDIRDLKYTCNHKPDAL